MSVAEPAEQQEAPASAPTTPGHLDAIRVRGAREHNLRGIDVDIPRHRLTVVCGVSGSGKSSLAFDTVFAEGQRRYVESLSSYARQFLGQHHKSDVDSIDGLSPAVAIDQKTRSGNPRSTVGTVTEIYDYLRVVYARAGIAHCPACGGTLGHAEPGRLHQTALDRFGDGARVLVLAPVVRSKKGAHADLFDQLAQRGFSRVRVDGDVHLLPYVGPALVKQQRHDIDVVVDRLVLRADTSGRLTQAVETAWGVADGLAHIEATPVEAEGSDPNKAAATRAGARVVAARGFACDGCGAGFAPLEPRSFSFNSPYGACTGCDGLGVQYMGDETLIVPDPTRTLAGGAIACWGGIAGQYQRFALARMTREEGIDLHTRWQDLPEAARRTVLDGTDVAYPTRWNGSTMTVRYEGVLAWLAERRVSAETDRRREIAEAYMRHVPCSVCSGGRLAPLPAQVTFAGATIGELCRMEASALVAWFDAAEIDDRTRTVVGAALREITERLGFLVDVGLPYLTLSRSAASLSGGEAQRIRLASQVGAALSGVLYVLDEPSIGLHPADNQRLIGTLERLRDLGNTVLVVEHDEETIERADHVIEIGPGAGRLGGELVYAGPPAGIATVERSPTGAYLSGRAKIATPTTRRPGDGELRLEGVSCHNIDDLTVTFPLSSLTVVAGPSGSGKSSLVVDTLWPVLARAAGCAGPATRDGAGRVAALTGADRIARVVAVDQDPIGRTPRSNAATYVGVFDKIRALFATLPEARARGYAAGRFSFNVAGGRCETCAGDGTLRIEMHFLPDVFVDCEACAGRRFNAATLEVTYRGKSIADVLAMPVETAAEFFSAHPAITRQLTCLVDVGLGYLPLGHPATLLSGGEAQRVKLAAELQRKVRADTLYILDEPTVGLHPADVAKLVAVLHRLVDAGATVVVVEHDLDMVRQADHVIDMGPAGGPAGGTVVAAGTPEEVAASSSPTAVFLRRAIGRRAHTRGVDVRGSMDTSTTAGSD